MQQLVAAEAEDRNDFRVDAPEITSGKCGDQVIQCRSVPEDAGRNFSDERSVAVVLERFARDGERRWQVSASGRQRLKHVECGDARRSDHADGWSTVPGVS